MDGKTVITIGSLFASRDANKMSVIIIKIMIFCAT